ncbi:TPM domain-containing protein [Flavobacterium sp. KBS0721]|uniref:TPM domain-containing protein n=1 Tax=Flavobacterium sp. KBS0721 TaxID=1179672 RepID=UPI00098E8C46|nr:TPM domain-containing protein [Flavobacterium sp. KBS0721]QDW20369.1 TPM domain-containing protein [Flavobacterium sp. KBS0721]
MSKVEDFLSKEEELNIVEAIRVAEKNTSGEIRVHIEQTTSKVPFDRALEVFHELKMNETQQQNGVLFYFAVADKTFAICGDKGINDLVAADFWDCTKDAMISQFKLGNFKQGIVDGILNAGEQLKKHFPWVEGDSNELSNEISKG